MPIAWERICDSAKKFPIGSFSCGDGFSRTIAHVGVPDALGKSVGYRKQDQVNRLLLSDGPEKLAKLRRDLNKASAKKIKGTELSSPLRFLRASIFFRWNLFSGERRIKS